MKKYLAEMIGTMVLVLMGCGSAVIGNSTGALGLLGIAFAFGLSVVAMAYAIGPISGCHINPAITLGAWLAGRIKGCDAMFYVLFQIIGAIIGSVLLWAIASCMGLEGTGANQYAEGQMTSALLAEFIFTFIFVLVVLGSTSDKAPAGFAGLAIGLALVLVHIVCIPITGTSVNPARSIGPAIFEGGVALKQLWLFILAPLAGGTLAAWVSNAFTIEWKALRNGGCTCGDDCECHKEE
ncbi:MAG: MIP family channel protein [Rikenellaceae bacterium]|jgi:aquaporin Z|nr:MIP family channel protein [Rikenellaceae bacterium]